MSHYNPVFIISKTAVMTLPTIAQSPATPRRDIQISRSFNRFHWLSISSNQRLSSIKFDQWENRISNQPYLLPCWKQLAYELWAKRLFRFVKLSDKNAPPVDKIWNGAFSGKNRSSERRNNANTGSYFWLFEIKTEKTTQ